MIAQNRRGRLVRWLVILILAILIGLYIGLPVAFGIAAVLPGNASIGAAPSGFTAVTLSTEDGVNLEAWYSPPSNGAAVIVTHGAGNSREEVRRYIDLLARHGYGVLALDLRGHGASAGRINRLGWQGTLDTGAAVRFLQTQDEVKVIGGLGLSMGAEILLGAASSYPEIQAIVAEGATHRSLGEMLVLETERPLYRNFTARVMFATVQLLSGTTPPYPLPDSMREARDTAFLLIAGGNVTPEIAYNTLFATTTGARATLWIAPDTPHTGAFNRYPDEYEQRVITFFDGELLGDE